MPERCDVKELITRPHPVNNNADKTQGQDHKADKNRDPGHMVGNNPDRGKSRGSNRGQGHMAGNNHRGPPGVDRKPWQKPNPARKSIKTEESKACFS